MSNIMNLDNQVTITGRVVRDVKKLTHDYGTNNMFTVAVDRNYQDKNGKTPVDFIDCRGFVSAKHPTKLYDYVKKGNTVTIAGSLESYTQQIAGQNITKLIVNVSAVKFVSSSKANRQAFDNQNGKDSDEKAPQESAQEKANSQVTEPVTNSEVPF